METIIIVSVLITLCVGTIIGSLVIAYMKLNRKVDVTEHDNDVLDVRIRINEDMKMIFDLISPCYYGGCPYMSTSHIQA